MIDEAVLADPARCPSCAAVLRADSAACPACRLPLTGPTAARLWSVCVEAAGLLAQRTSLIAALRAEAGAPDQAGQVVTAGAHAAPVLPPAPPPAPEWTPRRVQNLLLGLGVVLLGVAAVIFVAVSWGRLGVGGRAAVMTGLTALAATAAWHAGRRGLSATAEALSLLTVGLALLDCAGAWSADLAGLRALDGPLAAAGSAALVAAAAGAGSHALRTRALRVSAALLGQLPLPLVAAHLARTADQPAAVLAGAAAAQAVGALAVAALWAGRPDTRDARRVVGTGAGLAGLAATGLALLAAYAEPGSLVVGTVLLLGVAVAFAVASELVERDLLLGSAFRLAATLRAAAAALAVAAVWAPVVDATPSRWVPAALAAAGLALLAASGTVPANRRAAPAVVLLGAGWVPGLAAGPALTAALAGRVQWLGDAWSAQPGPLGASGSARGLLEQPATADVLAVHAGPAALLLLAVAAVAALAGLVHPPLRWASPVAALALAAAGLVAVAGLDGSYALGLAVDLALAAAGLGGAALLRDRAGWRGVAVSAAGAALVALGAGIGWSFAVDTATLTVLPLAAALLAGAVAATAGAAALRGPRVLATAAAVLLLVGQAAAATRYGGAGWPAVWVAATSLISLSGATAAVLVVTRAPAGQRFWVGTRDLAVGVAVAAVLADSAAVAWWQAAGVATVGLTASVAASAVLAAAALPVPATALDVGQVRVVAGVAGAAGVLTAAADADRLWLALLALGVAVAVLAVRTGQQQAGWLGGLLLTASSWVRLALSDVDAPEAYTVPPAVALLLVGWRRRAGDPSYRSWDAYAAGLALALGPSLLRAVTDAGNLRPFLLGAAALAVVAVGVLRRLQAPLLIGGGVLAVDALVQVAPYLAALYDVVPRWVTIGAAGLLLLAAGATYEQRVHDLRRVGRRMARLS